MEKAILHNLSFRRETLSLQVNIKRHNKMSRQVAQNNSFEIHKRPFNQM
jgi:hypothetical protein